MLNGCTHDALGLTRQRASVQLGLARPERFLAFESTSSNAANLWRWGLLRPGQERMTPRKRLWSNKNQGLVKTFMVHATQTRSLQYWFNVFVSHTL
eukprot:COSAG02_NODE_2324_length_9133_cov_38.463361_2_plen_96_part_00